MTQDHTLFQKLVDIAREPMLVLDEHMCIRAANRAFHQSFGASAHGAEGRLLPTAAAEQWHIPQLPELLERVVHRDENVCGYELHHDVPGTGRRTYLLNAGQIRPAANEPHLVFLAFEDVTERYERERERTALVDELTRSNTELERFAYVASHDLQEPLRMVASFTQLLARQYAEQLDDRAREYIHYAVDGATRMQQLTNDLLAYARLRSAPLDAVSADANAVFDDAVAVMASAIASTNATVSRAELPAVLIDHIQLAQVFHNLLANALKFRSATPLRVRVAATLADGTATFSVSDNGIGIAAEYYDRIFEVFQRLHTRSEYPGSGIGLAICRRIIEIHSGRIWVESCPGEGSVFSFTLPLAAQP